jgi:serine/threonine-protein kinase RsbW
MPTVDISFAALPAHVRTARLIAVAVARRANVPDEVLDELRLAVGEACSRAVALHQRHAPDALVRMTLDDEDGGFSVEVVDAGPPDQAPPAMDALVQRVHTATDAAAAGGVTRNGASATDEGTAAYQGDLAAYAGGDHDHDTLRDVLPPGFGLAVIIGLVDRVDVTAASPTGTRVRMTWPAGREAGESLAASGG